jgi:hypothetical protein
MHEQLRSDGGGDVPVVFAWSFAWLLQLIGIINVFCMVHLRGCFACGPFAWSFALSFASQYTVMRLIDARATLFPLITCFSLEFPSFSIKLLQPVRIASEPQATEERVTGEQLPREILA